MGTLGRLIAALIAAFAYCIVIEGIIQGELFYKSSTITLSVQAAIFVVCAILFFLRKPAEE